MFTSSTSTSVCWSRWATSAASMAYTPDAAPENLVSLTMPVRTESYPWDDELHPIFRMNLPEGYLLQVLQEEFGPHIGASRLRCSRSLAATWWDG